ncbi:MAG: hypothetical protein HY544_03355 [Candidatus Diapherotrites archaeon]|uniref:Class III signal peptide-containing protein n=1 Tax=Candidatus Iainarchaeum sp. TaxID=3101447 RepID=A0A8T3YKG1_9ARCH|nr:hypothetical protein [Candidatus Diapherotrites archaeon]
MEHPAEMRKKNATGTRGQATVEFILVLLIAVTFLAVIIQPNADLATGAMHDTQNLAKLRLSADKLVNTIQYVSVSGVGTKESIQTVIPVNASITCGTTAGKNTIVMNYTSTGLKGTASCLVDEDNASDTEGKTCKKTFGTGAIFTCTQDTVPIKPATACGTSTSLPSNTIATCDSKLSLYNVLVTKLPGGAISVDFSVVQ